MFYVNKTRKSCVRRSRKREQKFYFLLLVLDGGSDGAASYVVKKQDNRRWTCIVNVRETWEERCCVCVCVCVCRFDWSNLIGRRCCSALSSKTDHFVYLVAQVVVLRDTRNRFDWARLVSFPRPLVSPFVFPFILFIYFFKAFAQLRLFCAIDASNRVRNGEEESGWSMIQCQRCGRERPML